MSEENELYQRAKKRVDDLKGFYTHAAIYFAVNFGIFMVDVLTGNGWWFYWSAVFWGIGLVIHGVVVFVVEGFLTPGWEERKIQELIAKEEGRKVKNDDGEYFEE